MFERGFKSWCEQRSLELRRQLDLRHTDPVDTWALAAHLKIRVCTASDIKDLSAEARKALEADDAGWWAVTLEFPEQQRKLIILNQTHSLRQQSSDLTDELSHHLCEHRPFSLEVSEEGLLMLETYSRKDEEEADWLSGCLLLPRPALMHIKHRFADENAAAESYLVSRAMLKYRLDVSGVNYQLRRASAC